jgi:hypothetical protein
MAVVKITDVDLPLEIDSFFVIIAQQFFIVIS